MGEEPQAKGEILLYQTEDGFARLEVRLKGETVWLTQKQMTELFQKDVRTINEHIKNIFEEGELESEAVIRKATCMFQIQRVLFHRQVSVMPRRPAFPRHKR